MPRRSKHRTDGEVINSLTMASSLLEPFREVVCFQGFQMRGRSSLYRGDDNCTSNYEASRLIMKHSSVYTGHLCDPRRCPRSVGGVGTEEVYSRGRGKDIGRIISHPSGHPRLTCFSGSFHSAEWYSSRPSDEQT